ncbi:MAG TPA: hypothetical protein VG432_07480, partial [Gemmatimonadaceae bacterium]|nr:hypothetical protein [Gemmatimonadaceae bacterium]
LSNSGSQGYGASGSDSSSFGSTGGSSAGTAGSSSFGAGSSGSGSFGGSADSFADKARDSLSGAKDKAKSGLAGAKDKATELKATLADKLEAGANKLRSQQAGTGAYAGAGTGSPSVAAENGQLGQLTDKLATGMQGTADFIRNADLDQMKSGIEKQVKENPGRSLLIAAGLGYLLGKAFRK